MKKTLQSLGCIAFALVLLLGLLCGAILSAGGSSQFMNTLFLRHATPGITGVDTAEYSGLAEKITTYLTGKEDTFQTTLSVHGQMREAFSEKELTHMQDVKDLFALCKTLLMVSIAYLLLWTALLFADRKNLPYITARMYLITGACVAAIGLSLAIWAAIDFHTLFTLFHKVFFTNNLWQLNPKQDLLLQLMPTGFFVDYAARIGLVWLCGGIIFAMIALLYLRKRKQRT